MSSVYKGKKTKKHCLKHLNQYAPSPLAAPPLLHPDFPCLVRSNRGVKWVVGT